MPPIINSAIHTYKSTGRACPCPACPHPACLRPFPYFYLTPQNLCRIFGSIFSKFSRITTTIHLSSSNGALKHPYFTPTKIYVAFSDRFSPNSLASQPPKCRGYLLLASCQPASDHWRNRMIKIARIPFLVYTKSHHSSRDMLSLLTYRSHRSLCHHL